MGWQDWPDRPFSLAEGRSQCNAPPVKFSSLSLGIRTFGLALVMVGCGSDNRKGPSGGSTDLAAPRDLAVSRDLTPPRDFSVIPPDLSQKECVPKCLSDKDCADTCQPVQDAVNCCDLQTNTCYPLQDKQCPAPVKDMGRRDGPY